MLKLIEEFLARSNYRALAQQINNIEIFYRIIDSNESSQNSLSATSKVSCIVTVDGRMMVLMPQDFDRIKDQVKEAFASKGYSAVDFLLILISSSPENGRALASAGCNLWLIDDSLRLILYENSSPDFYSLKEGLEDTLLRKIESENESSGFKDRTVGQYLSELTWKSKAPMTVFLCLINIAIFIGLSLIGSTEDVGFMLSHGALYPEYILKDGQYWRFLSSIFLHFGIEHLGANMLSLYIFGERVETALGKTGLLSVYLFSGIGGGILSLFISNLTHSYAASAGASGAIFGIIGAMFMIVIKNHGKFKELTTYKAALLIGYSLFAGFTGTGIDNAAHIGGLITGIIFGLIAYQPLSRGNLRK